MMNHLTNSTIRFLRLTCIFLIMIASMKSLCSDDDYFQGEFSLPVDIAGGSLENPTKLTRLSLPRISEVDNRRESFYAITALNPGTSYTISLVRLEDDVDLFVYDSDSSFSTTVCTGETSGTTEESCTFTATGAAVFVKVTENTTTEFFNPVRFMIGIQ